MGYSMTKGLDAQSNREAQLYLKCLVQASNKSLYAAIYRYNFGGFLYETYYKVLHQSSATR